MKSINGYTVFLVGVLIVWQNVVLAQKADTIINIPGLKVMAPSLIGDAADSVDISHEMSLHSIAPVLRNQGNVYFRDYGPGSSSTISMFGSKPNEVALVWNGIKVTNPMLGVNDYSMISPAEMSSIRVARVGSSTVYGAGSGAGAILVDQHVSGTDQSVKFSSGWSSVNRLTGEVVYTNSIGKWKHRTSLSSLYGKNNFRYTTLDGNSKRLTHAQEEHISGTHHAVFQNRLDRYWTLSIWTRKQNREIPPALTEPSSEATQSDAFIRSVLQYQSLHPNHRLHIKAYYGFQNQQYGNPRIKLDAHHLFQNAQVRMDNQWQPENDIYIKYGMLHNFFSAKSDNYSDLRNQYRLSVYVQPRYEIRHLPLVITGLVQPEWINDHKIGWTNELKLKYRHNSTGKWVLFANQNIVWPTLNDLYWNPGGNPNLQPEKNRMGGLSWKNNWINNLESSMTFYYRQAENWIQWIPTDLGYWRPFNARKGKSYGLHMEVDYRLKKYIKIVTGYQFVRTYFQDDQSSRNQAIYTPKHMWNLRSEYNPAKLWTLYANGEYTSTRFVTRDHSEDLHPYFLLHAGIRFWSKNKLLGLGFEVRNALGTEYQGIKNRPMPGRQFEINTQIKF